MSTQRWSWRIVLITYAALVFAVSSLSLRGEGSMFPFPYGDKLAHFLEFGLFALFAAKASFGKRPLMYAFILTAVYAGTDEFHQIFVQYRDPSLADWGADVVGAAVAIVGFILLRRWALLAPVHQFILNRRDSDKGD